MVLLSYRGDETLDFAIFGVDNIGLDLVAAANVLTGGELEEDEEQNVDTPCTRILMEHGQQTASLELTCLACCQVYRILFYYFSH